MLQVEVGDAVNGKRVSLLVAKDMDDEQYLRVTLWQKAADQAILLGLCQFH